MKWTLVFMLLIVGSTTVYTRDIKQKYQPVGQELNKDVLPDSRPQVRVDGNKDPDKDNTPLFYVAISFGFVCGLGSLVLMIYLIHKKLANIQPVRRSLYRQRNGSERSGEPSLMTSRNEPRDPPVDDV